MSNLACVSDYIIVRPQTSVFMQMQETETMTNDSYFIMQNTKRNYSIKQQTRM